MAVVAGCGTHCCAVTRIPCNCNGDCALLTDFLSWLGALTCPCQGLLLLTALCPGGIGGVGWFTERMRFEMQCAGTGL